MIPSHQTHCMGKPSPENEWKSKKEPSLKEFLIFQDSKHHFFGGKYVSFQGGQRSVPQNYHTLALFDPPKIWNVMTTCLSCHLSSMMMGCALHATSVKNCSGVISLAWDGIQHGVSPSGKGNNPPEMLRHACLGLLPSLKQTVRPLKIGLSTQKKRKGSSPNHHFSGPKRLGF